jgi:hypothetical protein
MRRANADRAREQREVVADPVIGFGKRRMKIDEGRSPPRLRPGPVAQANGISIRHKPDLLLFLLLARHNFVFSLSSKLYFEYISSIWILYFILVDKSLIAKRVPWAK